MPITKSKTTFKLDLFGKSDKGILNDGERNSIRRVVADKLTDLVFLDMESQRSSVSGQRWKGLSPDYAKRKGRGQADLFLSGKMRGKIRSTKTTKGIEFGIFAPSQAIKSFNHNTGDTLPQRQFIPNESSGEGFRTGINKQLAAEILRESQSIINKKLTKKVKELNTIASKLK